MCSHRTVLDQQVSARPMAEPCRPRTGVKRATASPYPSPEGQAHRADIARVQEWLGHASISTTPVYDGRESKPEDSPTFRVVY